MSLTCDQEDEVRKRVIDQFGLDSVKKMDSYYLELNDIRISCKDPYEFLEKVKAKYPDGDTDLLLAAILYGVKQGELGYQYYLRQQQGKTDNPPKCWNAS